MGLPVRFELSFLFFIDSSMVRAVFSLGLYQRAQCPLGLLMCPLGLAQNQNAPFGVLAAT